LRLLYGIGESTETKLRLAGYTSLRELFISPAFGLAGRVNPSGPREARPFRLYPSCHPLVSHFARSPSLASPPSNCLPQRVRPGIGRKSELHSAPLALHPRPAVRI
jgi:hypothetical protein